MKSGLYAIVGIILLLSGQPCSAGSEDPRGSQSLLDAQKDKLLIGKVTVVPSAFAWEGHAISIREAWLEHALIRQEDKKHPSDDWDFLCFTLDFDGHHETGKFSDKKQLEFVREDLDLKRFTLYGDLSKIQSTRLVIFGRNKGFDPVRHIRHGLGLPSKNIPPELRARAITVYQDYGKQWTYPLQPGRTERQVKSSVVLTFKLPSIRK